MIRNALPLFAAILIAGCGNDPAPVPETGDGSAEGDVMEGSISDAMIPLSELESQSPTIAEAPSSGGGGGETESSPAPVTAEPAPEAEASEPEESGDDAGEAAPEEG